MISLIEYIKEQQEKSLFFEGKTITIDVPGYDASENELTGKTWKKLVLPDAKFVVYKDYYHKSMWHFAAIGDMIGAGMYYFQDDFEDFDPKKDILCFGDDYKEVIAEMFKKISNFDLTKYSNVEEAIKAFDEMSESKRRPGAGWRGNLICDDETMLFKFYFGEKEPEEMSAEEGLEAF